MNSIAAYNPNIAYTPRDLDPQFADVNWFFATIMDPIAIGGVKVPDYGLLPTTTKRILISDTINVPTNATNGTPLIGVMFTPNDPENVGYLFIYWEAQGLNRWYFWRALSLTESLTANYARSRTVSAALSLTSASIATGLATLQGTVDAVAYQDFWNLFTAAPNSILPYNQDDKSIVTNVPLAKGVIMLAQPYEDNELQNIEGTSVHYADSVFFTVNQTVAHSTTADQLIGTFIFGAYQLQIACSVNAVAAVPNGSNCSVQAISVIFNPLTNTNTTDRKSVV